MIEKLIYKNYSNSIPSDWKEKPFWSIATQKSIKGEDNLQLLSIYLKKGVIKFADVKTKRTNVTSDDKSKYQRVDPGDFVMNNQQSWRGSVGVSQFTGIVSPAYLIFKISSELNSSYANYLLRDKSMVEKYLLSSRGVGSIQRNLHFPSLKTVKVLIPPTKEQKIISQFLDKKMKKIDILIEKIEEKIELLKEQKIALITQYVTKGIDLNIQTKDSGVEWIGKIPKSWTKIKIKYLTEDHRQGFYTSDPYDEEGIPILRITDINEQNKFDIKNSPKYNREHKEIKDFYLQKGDFLFPRTGGVGRFGIIDFDDLCIYGSFLIRFRFNNKTVTRKFMKFYFLSEFFKSQIRSEIHGGVNQNVHVENIKSCFLFLPNKKEQNYITEKLVGIESKINKLVKSYQSKLDLYNEYRQSIISSAVTGKIRITEDMI